MLLKNEEMSKCEWSNKRDPSFFFKYINLNWEWGCRQSKRL